MEALVLETALSHLKIEERHPLWDIYSIGERRLTVALDRISWEGYSIEGGVPYKGHYTARIVAYLASLLRPKIPTCFLTDHLSFASFALQNLPEGIAKRAWLTRRVSPIPLFCEMVGYLYGKYYQNIRFFSGLTQGVVDSNTPEGAKLDPPLLLIRGKKRRSRELAYLTFGQVVEVVGDRIAQEVYSHCKLTFQILQEALLEKGLLLGKVSLTWGFSEGKILLLNSLFGGDDLVLWKTSPKGGAPFFPLSYEKMPLEPLLPPTFPKEVQIQLTSKLSQEIGRRYAELAKILVGESDHHIEMAR